MAVLRPFNTYGPRQSRRAFIPTVINQILDKNKNELLLGNLNSYRDFNYVEDTANAFVAMVESFENCIGDAFNACSNFEISMCEIVKILQEISRTNKEIKIDSKRLRPDNSEVDRLWGQNKKILNHTNWKPHYSGLDGFLVGLEKTFEWYKDYGINKNSSSYEV